MKRNTTHCLQAVEGQQESCAQAKAKDTGGSFFQLACWLQLTLRNESFATVEFVSGFGLEALSVIVGSIRLNILQTAGLSTCRQQLIWRLPMLPEACPEVSQSRSTEVSSYLSISTAKV